MVRILFLFYLYENRFKHLGKFIILRLSFFKSLNLVDFANI